MGAIRCRMERQGVMQVALAVPAHARAQINHLVNLTGREEWLLVDRVADLTASRPATPTTGSSKQGRRRVKGGDLDELPEV